MTSTIAVPHLQARPRLSPELQLAKTCRRRGAIPFRCVANANAIVPATFAGMKTEVLGRKRTATIGQAVQTEKGSIAGPGSQHLHRCHTMNSYTQRSACNVKIDVTL